MAELNKVSVDDLKVTGKRVLVRVDFNVPMKDGVITNDNRIQAALPTINKLVSEGAKVILCSHLGKPKNGPEEKFSLKAAAARLAELVSAKVTFVPSDVVVDDTVRTAVDKMQNGETNRRRKIQAKYNEEHDITPQTIKKAVRDLISISKKVETSSEDITKDIESMSEKEIDKLVAKIKKQMHTAAAELNFELAAKLRDQLIEIKKLE